MLLGSLLLHFCLLASSAEPPKGASVYLLRMSSSFDLYLANQLTQSGMLTVVTDPALAQYVLTESVGGNFELMMDSLFKKDEPKQKDEAAETDAKDADSETATGPKSMIDAYEGTPPRISTFSRGQGNIFLVNRDSSTIVWSTFLERREQRSEKLNRAAAEVVKRLKKHIAASADGGAIQ